MTARSKRITINIARYAALALISCIFVFPMFLMLTKSFMSDNDANFAVLLIPKHFSAIGFTRVFNAKTIYWIGNTLIIYVLNVVGIVVSASLCAFGFAKMKFRGREFFFGLVLATMMLPAISMQIPLYVIYSRLNWIGTWYPMTVPAFFGGGAGTIFLMRQFMKNVPDQFSEAARIDGANKFMIYLRIVMPLCFPIIAYTAVTCFIGVWNDFQNPLMYLGNYESKFTISLGLYKTYKVATTNANNFPNVQMAAGVLMTVPCVILFFLFQRTLIGGITMGGIKG